MWLGDSHKLKKFGLEVLIYSSYSPYIALSDYHLFLSLMEQSLLPLRLSPKNPKVFNIEIVALAGKCYQWKNNFF